MTNKQAIDGVSRALLERLLNAAEWQKMDFVRSESPFKVEIVGTVQELRALLDNDVTWLCDKCKTEQPTNRACDACGGKTKPAAPPQGEVEPVARLEVGADRNAALTVTDEDWLRMLKSQGVHQVVPLYAAQPQGEVEPAAWTRNKPTVAGAYWLRGNGLERDALIQVVDDPEGLRCNLHQRTTNEDFGWGYAVADLSGSFEWLGPLFATLSTSAEPKPRGDAVAHLSLCLKGPNKGDYIVVKELGASGNDIWSPDIPVYADPPSHSGDASEMVAKVVLPERYSLAMFQMISGFESVTPEQFDLVWSACRAEAARLNGVKP